MVQKSKINYTFEGFDDGSREVIRVSAFGHDHMRLMRKELKMPKLFHRLFLYRLNQSVKKAIYLASK